MGCSKLCLTETKVKVIICMQHSKNFLVQNVWWGFSATAGIVLPISWNLNVYVSTLTHIYLGHTLDQFSWGALGGAVEVCTEHMKPVWSCWLSRYRTMCILSVRILDWNHLLFPSHSQSECLHFGDVLLRMFRCGIQSCSRTGSLVTAILGQESLETPACKFCNLLSEGEIPLHVLFYDSQVLIKFISYDPSPFKVLITQPCSTISQISFPGFWWNVVTSGGGSWLGELSV